MKIMYRKILIPLDNSSADQAIIDHIQPLVKLTGGEVILVHVADGYAARLQNQLNLADSEEIKGDKSYLEKRQKELQQYGLKVRTILVQGEPADGILSVADQEKCDLIAMATHGHKFVKDLILGSVADVIRHRTDIPILMIRASMK
jgi:nucleotide-binding universal stress UspA family protein